jgi:pimeloyl-ACP methyl ester carboxylesterase
MSPSLVSQLYLGAAKRHWTKVPWCRASGRGSFPPRSRSPVAITVFPEDSYRARETWTRRAYRNLTYFHEVDEGGHFAAWEEPELFAAEIRAGLGSLR